VLLSLLQLGFGIASCVAHGFQVSLSTPDSKGDKFWTGITLSSAAACDIVITASMVYYLRKSQTNLGACLLQAQAWLITFMIRSFLLTTVCMLSALITFLVFPNTLVHAAFYFIACRLYSTSLLSTLNSRETIAEKGGSQGGNLGSLRFGGVSANSTNTSNDGDGIIVIGSDKWSLTETHSKPHKKSDGKAPYSDQCTSFWT